MQYEFLFVSLFIVFFFGQNQVCARKKNPVLLISCDGFRADKFDLFIKENPESNLKKLVDSGVKADFMKPSFPSFTFPNHWTIVTGLYPGTHGVIANEFYDPDYNETVFLQTSSGQQIQWWNTTEPIWLTAKNQGLKTATSFWPGSETWPYVADIYLPFMKTADFDERSAEVVDWFKKFDMDFATLYFNQPDAEGHAFGPNGLEYYKMIGKMDIIIGNLMDKLKAESLYDNMNIILVSDHGMSEIKNRSGFIELSDHFNTSIIDLSKTTYSKVSQVYPAMPELSDELLDKINNISHLNAYLKNDVPEEFHYSNNSRIGDIVVIADEGFTLKKTGNTNFNPGQHGYNNSLLSMRTIFIARGPDFKVNHQIESFENVNVYPLMCDLLQINCHKSDGSIKLADIVLKSGESSTFALNMKTILISLIITIFFSKYL